VVDEPPAPPPVPVRPAVPLFVLLAAEAPAVDPALDVPALLFPAVADEPPAPPEALLVEVGAETPPLATADVPP
jgi:hypothetical protein